MVFKTLNQLDQWKTISFCYGVKSNSIKENQPQVYVTGPVVAGVHVAGLGPGPCQRGALGTGLAMLQLLHKFLFLVPTDLFLSIELLHHAHTFLQNFPSPLFLFGNVFCFVFRCLRTFPFKKISEGIFENTAPTICLLSIAACIV